METPQSSFSDFCRSHLLGACATHCSAKAWEVLVQSLNPFQSLHCNVMMFACAETASQEPKWSGLGTSHPAPGNNQLIIGGLEETISNVLLRQGQFRNIIWLFSLHLPILHGAHNYPFVDTQSERKKLVSWGSSIALFTANCVKKWDLAVKV
jgi:hypothetical protein